MNIKIIADSSSNLHRVEGNAIDTVPLKIVTDEREFCDDASLNVDEMLSYMQSYSGRSGTSCPNVGEWLDAFGDAEAVFTVSITSGLSGCHNAAQQAAHMYLGEHPDRKTCCLDTLSTGPEMVLIVEKLQELIARGLDFDKIKRKIHRYMESTHLLFMLERMDNLANNGRVSPLIAKAAGLLGIRVVGSASDKGTLHQEHKCRGEKKALGAMLKSMIDRGYEGGKVRIAHCANVKAAVEMSALIREVYPNADVQLHECGGLCCFYAEQGGLLLGYEA